MVPTIEPRELAKRLAKGEVQLVDVREPKEHQLCAIPGDVLIPLGQLLQRLEELDKNKPVVCYCHTGNRSLVAAQRLSKAGFKAINLSGGIDQWAEELDPEMERY